MSVCVCVWQQVLEPTCHQALLLEPNAWTRYTGGMAGSLTFFTYAPMCTKYPLITLLCINMCWPVPVIYTVYLSISQPNYRIPYTVRPRSLSDTKNQN